MECFNRTLGTALAKYVQNDVRSWDRYIHSVLFAYRTTIQVSTQFSPFRLCYGINGRLPVDLEWSTDEIEPDKDAPATIAQRAEQILCKVEPDRLDAHQNILKAQAKQKKQHDRYIEKDTYKMGDKVLLLRSDLLNRHDVKLVPKWDGLLYVREVLPNHAYVIRTEDGEILK